MTAALLAGLIDEDTVDLCGDCGNALLHRYCTQCRRRTDAVRARRADAAGVSARLAAESARVAFQREMGYAG